VNNLYCPKIYLKLFKKTEQRKMKSIKRIRILDVPVDAISKADALEIFTSLMNKTGLSLIVTPNAEIVEDASRDLEFKAIIESAELIIPDGIGIVFASKILKYPLIEKRVTGIDFLSDILIYLQETGKSIYLLGSESGIAELAAEKMKEKYPDLKIAGTHHGYFDGVKQGNFESDEAKAIVANINESGADFLCVAMGSKRQEKFIYTHKDSFTDVRAAMGVGGSLDVWAGKLKRAPKLLQSFGFEWLYRFIQEPSRYKRMIKLPIFMLRVIFSKKS